MPKSPTPSRGWKPRETYHRDGNRGPPPHVQEHLKTCAAANKERLQGQHAEEVKESQEKYDRGGNNSYPRTGRDHNKWCEKKHRSGRHISLTAGDDIGRVRGESHDADTDFKARTHASLDKRAFRRNQGGKHRRPTNNSGRKRGRDGTYTGPTQLSATPGLMVVPFHPDEIGIPEPDDDVILVQGQTGHYGVIVSGGVYAFVSGGSTPSSHAEPTPVADSAPAASSSVVDPMPVTAPAAEAPPSLAEPTPSPTAPVVRPEAVATTPAEGPACVPEVCYLGLSIGDHAKVRRTSGKWSILRVIDLGTTVDGSPFITFRVSKDPVQETQVVKKIRAPFWDRLIRPLEEGDLPPTREAARPSVIPSRPGVTRSTGDGPTDRDGATPIPSTGGAAHAAAAPSPMAEPMEVSEPTAAAPSLPAEPMPATTPSDDGAIADHDDREDAPDLSSSGDEAGPTDALDSDAAFKDRVAAAWTGARAEAQRRRDLNTRFPARADTQARLATRAETQTRRDLDLFDVRHVTLRRGGPLKGDLSPVSLSIGNWVEVQRTSGTWERARVETIRRPVGELPFIKFCFSDDSTQVIRAPLWDSHICLDRIWYYDSIHKGFVERNLATGHHRRLDEAQFYWRLRSRYSSPSRPVFGYY
ncbi:hypothetical protein THAOC_17579 [Thalassiosira oceanica]|uniref:Uncharacterized protein n=1 Tax=Thalassiosira oceanica TaxID=159749 RepID=K0SLL7_THAOC|nr:hypothetical protein THAOC_17579 [Thalassiosira oceanica]|eukprot:EJK61856.1 hypothetical protein THAOC_17579 [Thalassiosira oceanica]